MFLVVLFTHYRKEHCIKFLKTFITFEEAELYAKKFYDPPSEIRKRLSDVWEYMLGMQPDEYIQCNVFKKCQYLETEGNQEHINLFGNKDAPIMQLNIKNKSIWYYDISLHNLVQAHKVLIHDDEETIETFENGILQNTSMYVWTNPHIGIFRVE